MPLTHFKSRCYAVAASQCRQAFIAYSYNFMLKYLCPYMSTYVGMQHVLKLTIKTGNKRKMSTTTAAKRKIAKS